MRIRYDIYLYCQQWRLVGKIVGGANFINVNVKYYNVVQYYKQHEETEFKIDLSVTHISF